MDEKEKLEIDALHERMLRKQLWVIIAERVGSPAEMSNHLKAHLEYQISLEKQGIMYGAGPAASVRADYHTGKDIAGSAKDCGQRSSDHRGRQNL
jgi:hypothetical protein